MKKAFTMLELVFVIVVVGILSFMAASRFERNTLQEAADQVVGHIRYTQHLAMINDKFISTDATWYKTRWQIIFSTSATYTNGKISYSIFSDMAGSHTGQADISEIAKNPLDNSKLLSGGYAGTFYTSDSRATKEMNIGNKYGIDTYSLSGGCANSRISFDYLGRPITGDSSTSTAAYITSRIIKTQCRVTLQSGTNAIVIAIEPETGFTHIL